VPLPDFDLGPVLTHNPLHVVAEILGEPADRMRNPANADYQCPFLASRCVKSSKNLTEPYPVCSVYRTARRGIRSTRAPICVCPNRFYEVQIQEDVLQEAWKGPRPQNPRVVHEVTMQKFGRVDFVLSDYDEANHRVRQFLPVELQAVDITRTVLPSYLAILSSQAVGARPQYGFNWANVRKRYVSQLIAKGFYCHHWGTRIVAVLQTDLFEEFQKHARVATVSLDDANIVFMLYQFAWDESAQRWQLKLERVVPTTHVSVMNAILYETPPSRDKFESRILDKIGRDDGPHGTPVIETVGEVEPAGDDALGEGDASALPR
jgi:hypothetical protein